MKYQKTFVTCKLNCHDQKIRQTLVRDIRKHWTALSTLLGLISSVYHDFSHLKSNKRPQNAELPVHIACVQCRPIAQ